jgi:hypothetical protein
MPLCVCDTALLAHGPANNALSRRIVQPSGQSSLNRHRRTNELAGVAIPRSTIWAGQVASDTVGATSESIVGPTGKDILILEF